MINDILVAIDGSVYSLKAVQTAAEIAKACDAKLTIFAAVKLHQQPKISPELSAYAKLENVSRSDIDGMVSRAHEYVRSAKALASDMGVTKIATFVETGPVARTIVAAAKRLNTDMIVVGSRGMGGLEATLRGGVSHRVELLAKCSVLTVK